MNLTRSGKLYNAIKQLRVPVPFDVRVILDLRVACVECIDCSVLPSTFISEIVPAFENTLIREGQTVL